ncbi:MAG: hypothetical protein WCG01_01415 [bacterium]
MGNPKQQNPQTPPVPRRTLHVFAGTPHKIAVNQYRTHITGKVCFDGVDDSTASIWVKENGLDIHSVTGRLNYDYVKDATDVEQNIQLIIESGVNSEAINVVIPIKDATAVAPRPNEPETLLMSTSCGIVFASVLTHTGLGLPNIRVQFRINGHAEYADTDGEGNCQLDCTRFIINQRVKVYGRVSQIVHEACVTLDASGNAPTPLTGSFWEKFKNRIHPRANNFRANWGMLATILWLFVCLSVGYGKPVIQEYLPTFQANEVDLSQEARAARKKAVSLGLEAESQPIKYEQTEKYNPVAEKIRGGMWLLLGLMLAFFPIYWLLSWREEIAEVGRETLHAMLDNHRDRADDPFFEKFGKWFGSVSTAKKTSHSSTSSSATPTTTESTQGSAFMDFLKMDLIVELLTSMLPKLFKKLFN